MRSTAASIAIAAALLVAGPSPARAASYVAQDIWYSTLYGAAIGGIAGTGVMLLSDDPMDHTDYVVTGVGVGILTGLAYGIYSYSVSGSRYSALANVEAGGATHYAVPMPQPFISRKNGQESVGVKVDLVRGRF
jgi:hypothetical protein